MDIDRLWDSASDVIVDHGVRIVGVLLLLLFAWIVAGWLGRAVVKGLSRARIDETLAKFLGRLARWLVLVLALLACLSVFGVETTSFAAVIGSAGLAVGLAFQGTLSHFASGMMLLLFRPFGVGDVITIAGQTGKVDEIQLFTTTLDTFDNRRFIIPNGQIFGSTIENISHHTRRRADVAVGVSYVADIEQTREILTKAAERVPGALDEPEPAVVLLDLGDSAVNWSVRIWAAAENYGEVKQAATQAVKVALDEAGIEIPYPQMDVHLTKTE